MPKNILHNYSKIEEIFSNNNNIKTYKAKKDFLIKEIYFQNEVESNKIKSRIEKIKNDNEIKIEDYQEEENRIIVIIDNNEKMNSEFDSILSLKYEITNAKIEPSNEYEIIKEGTLKNHIGPVSKEELMKLFEKELSMCKIEYKPNENKFEPKEGNGFFCQINLKENPSFPFKYCLFTNNHIINHSYFDNGIININYNKSINFIQKFLKQKESVPKELDHIDKRRFFTSKLLDYSCIEMFENEIKNIFNIDPFIFKEDKILCGEEIFILQYPKEKNISFSGGKITEVKESHFRYNASTEEGSSGSPIIRRLDITSLQESEYQVIGIHSSAAKKKTKDYPEYNFGIGFDLIIPDIIFKNNALKIIKIQNENINLNCFLTGDEIGIREIFKIIQFGNEYKIDKNPMLNPDNENTLNKNYTINETKIQIGLTTDNKYNFATEKRYSSSLPLNLIKNCICLFLVYDISTTESFEDIKKIIKNLEKEIKKNTLLVLVGIKLKEERNIIYEEGYKLSYKNKMLFFEIDINSKNACLKLDNDLKKVISEILSDLKLLKKR